MKKLFQLLLLVTFIATMAPTCVNARIVQKGMDTYSFTVQKKQYRFSTSFDIDSEEIDPGRVDKSCFGIRTWYYLYGCDGKQKAYGICSFFCLGLLYDWATEIYVYDGKERLGWIDGQVGTTAAAKFSFYDSRGNRVGIAYLDKDKTGFDIVDTQGNVRIATLKRNYVIDAVDDWTVTVYRPDVSPELIRIFAAFVVDRQESWREDR